jgi:hypothetical protein
MHLRPHFRYDRKTKFLDGYSARPKADSPLSVTKSDEVSPRSRTRTGGQSGREFPPTAGRGSIPEQMTIGCRHALGSTARFLLLSMILSFYGLLARISLSILEFLQFPDPRWARFPRKLRRLSIGIGVK